MVRSVPSYNECESLEEREVGVCEDMDYHRLASLNKNKMKRACA